LEKNILVEKIVQAHQISNGIKIRHRNVEKTSKSFI